MREALRPFNLKKASKGGDKATITAILDVFELSPDHEIKSLWEAMGELHNKAHRNALATPRQIEDVRETWEIFQRLLHLLVKELDGAWPIVYRRIDAILSAQQPGENHITQLRNNIPNNPNTFRHFFNGATSKEWVAAITRDESLFTDPPEIGPWPAIEYLLRITQEYPDAVHRLVTGLPSTPNVYTHMTIMQVADALPPHLAKDLVALEAAAFRDGVVRDPSIATDLAKAAARVASADATAALQSFEQLLALHKPLGESVRDLVSPLELHAYVDAINAVASVSTHAPRATYDMLASLLDKALTAAHGETNDDSNGWMPAIEPHEQNRHHYEPLPYLGGAVRDAAEACVKADPTSRTALISDAAQRRWTFFHRLALHLMRNEPTSPAAHDRAMQPDLLRDWRLKHEARLLLHAVFPHLSGNERAAIVDAILAGPQDVDKGMFESDEQRQQYREWWITQRLWWVRDWLPQHAKQEYERLVARHGQPSEKEDFVAWIGTMWVGPTSPKAAAELQEMSIPVIREFLSTWVPSGQRHFAPSREGVARELQTVVTKRAVEFSQGAFAFLGCDPTYIRAIMDGLQSAVQNEHAPIDWQNVIALSAWAVGEKREIEGRTEDGWDDDDPHWGWARGAIARLLEAGFHNGTAQIPITLRDQVWPLLERISADPDPTPEREAQHTAEPLSIALNSTRGQAMRAVMHYARWVCLTPPETERPTDFSDMPEVRALFEKHLASDPSIGVRAVFGEFLDHLHYFDRAWVSEHLQQLFPPEALLLHEATWQTHIVYGRTDRSLSELLMPEYERAAARLGEKPLYHHYPDQFAKHLLWMYADNQLTLNGGLIDAFFRAADPNTQAYAVGFVPYAVRDVLQQNDAYRQKLEAFWDWCSKREHLAPAHAGFGMWFTDETLDLTWRFTQLERALTLAGTVTRDFEVIKNIANAADAHPALALRCTELMMNGTDGMRGYTWVHQGHIRRIIAAARAHGDAATAAQARKFASHLVGQGFSQLLDLAE